MSAIQDFKIDIPKEKLVDLQKRLEMTRWPEKRRRTIGLKAFLCLT